jgi:hypothetical protein
MSMIVKGGGDFEPAPPGPSAAVCIDVVDLGMQDSQFGIKHKVRVVWSLEKRMKADRRSLGKPYIVQKTYSVSLHKKSTLRTDLEAWRGKAFDEKVLAQGFDLEGVLGKPAFLSIQHAERDGLTFANVVAIMPLPKGMPAPIADPEYVRHKDRKDDGRTGKRRAVAPTPHGDPAGEDAPEEIPGESYEEGEVERDADDIPF